MAAARWMLKALVVLLVTALTACASMAPDLTEPEVVEFATKLGSELAHPHEPLSGPLTADAAVARAIKHNFYIRARELEVAVALAKARSATTAMLPKLVAERDYYRRRAVDAASANAAGSTDLRGISRDITLSWNILDFGLSYVRAKQGLDKARQHQQDVYRITARIVEDTRSLYWRAIARERLSKAMKSLDGEVRVVLDLTRRAASDPMIDPMTAINYQRDILNLQRELNQLQISLVGATEQLKEAIGMPGASRLVLDASRRPRARTQIAKSADEDVALALRQRPEILQHMYDLRISQEEVYATILQVLPGVSFSKTYNGDGAASLFHPNWIRWGSQIAGNLIDVVRLPSDLEAVEGQKLVVRQNALATAATIVVQVHTARARISMLSEAFHDAARFAEMQRELLRQVRTAVDLGKTAQQALTREKLATLLADIRGIVAFADLEGAHAAYDSARGALPVPVSVPLPEVAAPRQSRPVSMASAPIAD